MRIAIVGGGPGGLHTALLLKKADPTRDIVVFDRNPVGATYGWGVVFSEETLGSLEEADQESHAAIVNSFVHWDAIDIYYRDTLIRSGGHSFSGLGRRHLLHILGERCRELGVILCFQEDITNESELAGYDLVVAADGLNSRLRSLHSDVFRPTFDTHTTRYIWLGAEVRLPAFTFIFRQTEWGMFQVHAYPFDSGMSTFIVECPEDTWRAAGLDRAGEEESVRFCAGLFAPELQGARLHSNRSAWISFVTLRNETWHHGNLVLLGDAAHTAHFSIGSGTKLAMEDGIALAEALQRQGRLRDALVSYEELRQPVVERTQTAARDSSRWFEGVRRYAGFDPPQFAFSLLTRSKRVTYDNLKLRDPLFSERVDRWFTRQAGVRAEIRPPAHTPLCLRSAAIPNRMVASLPCEPAGEGGGVCDAQLVEIGASRDAGLMLVRHVAVCAGGRLSPANLLLLGSSEAERWNHLVRTIHARNALAGIQLNHAGPRGAVFPRESGVDRPLHRGSWPLLAASPLPYTSRSQVPAAMPEPDMDRGLESFCSAARAADEAGFDYLEIEAGHGYLLGSFLSPLTNIRDDDFGGSIENRLRFPLAVVAAVRDVWPQEKPMGACLSLRDWARGGITEEEALITAQACVHIAIDIVHIGSGGTVAASGPPFARGWETALSDRVRNDLNVPTLLGGHLTSLDDINTVLTAGRADLCLAPSLS